MPQGGIQRSPGAHRAASISGAMGLRVIIFVLFVTCMPALGCSMLVGSATSGLARNLTTAVLDQDDPQLVEDGAPAYLMALDGLIEGSPKNETLLLAGARLYAAYASAFVVDPIRLARLTERARSYGHRAMCLANREICEASNEPFEEFVASLGKARKKDLPALYGFGSAWATWVQMNSGDWNAIAELPKVQALMERIVVLDDGYEQGGAHLYLGVLYTLRPTSLGGRPELGQQEFEMAVKLSDGRNLMAKVLYARQYARLVFDQDLYNRLLIEVIEADPVEPGLTLTNTMAQEMAAVLLAESEEYF